MDLTNAIISTKSPVGFMHSANANLTALMLVGNVCTTLLNTKPNINVKSSVTAVRLTLGDRSHASNRDLMRVGSLYSFETKLLMPRKILISTLANSLYKMNITREILACTGIFVNGSKTKFQILLPLLAQAEYFENPETREESPEPLPNPGASDDEIEDAITPFIRRRLCWLKNAERLNFFLILFYNEKIKKKICSFKNFKTCDSNFLRGEELL